MKTTAILSVLALALAALGACSIPGSATVPVSAQGAQTLTGQQGQAGDTSTATTNGSPIFAVILAASKVTLKTDPDGTTEMDVDGAENATVTITGPLWGESGVVYGDNAMKTENTLGGGSVAGASEAGGGGGMPGGTVTATGIPAPAPAPTPAPEGQ